MEKAHFKEKIDSMLPDLMDEIRKECNRLYDCGGIEPSAYENNYILPKTILSVAIRNQIRQYEPLSEDAKSDAKNLMYF